ncbi:GTD2A protein, partial [Atractosteus spatula]|nr:GTD2A protein [Atractosteus spatula]
MISHLKQQFQDHFQNFDSISENIRLFQNPFASEVQNLQPELQLEVIDLAVNDLYRDLFKGKDLFNFYKSLPKKSFKNIKTFARGMISVFASTYLCEQTFSKMKYVKPKYRTSLTDEHLKQILILGATV